MTKYRVVGIREEPPVEAAQIARLDHRHRGLWPGCYQPGQRAGCGAAHRQITMASASPADASQQTIYAHT